MLESLSPQPRLTRERVLVDEQLPFQITSQSTTYETSLTWEAVFLDDLRDICWSVDPEFLVGDIHHFTATTQDFAPYMSWVT
jgi:hypothetical protein